MPLPDPDLAAEMYEWADEILDANGYKQYEISNWAKEVEGQKSKVDSSTFDFQPLTPSFACKHNLQYWRSLPYLAFGAGAHGYADGYRYSNVLRIKTYIERLNTDHRSPITAFPLSPVTVNHHKQTLQDDMSEFMMTGLRLTQEGISEVEFADRFGTSLREVYGKEIDELLRLGLIEENPPLPEGEGLGAALSLSKRVRVKLTPRARLLANQVFMRFV